MIPTLQEIQGQGQGHGLGTGTGIRDTLELSLTLPVVSPLLHQEALAK